MTFNDNIQLSIAIGTGIASLCVLITMIVTIRNFSKQLKLNFFSEYTKRYQNIILNLPSNINDDSFDFEKLSEKKKEKTIRYLRIYFDLCSEEYFLSEHKNIDKYVWKEWKSGIEYSLSKKAFKDGWKNYINTNTIYYKEFASFIDEILLDIERKNDEMK